jgi:hypothetical protein
VKPERIVPLELVREVGGRLDYRGRELRALDEESVRAAARLPFPLRLPVTPRVGGLQQTDVPEDGAAAFGHRHAALRVKTAKLDLGAVGRICRPRASLSNGTGTARSKHSSSPRYRRAGTGLGEVMAMPGRWPAPSCAATMTPIAR